MLTTLEKLENTEINDPAEAGQRSPLFGDGDNAIRWQPGERLNHLIAERCAVEFNWVRWGHHDLPPQAGINVYERGPDGLLAAVRSYQDVAPPADLS